MHYSTSTKQNQPEKPVFGDATQDEILHVEEKQLYSNG